MSRAARVETEPPSNGMGRTMYLDQPSSCGDSAAERRFHPDQWTFHPDQRTSDETPRSRTATSNAAAATYDAAMIEKAAG